VAHFRMCMVAMLSEKFLICLKLLQEVTLGANFRIERTHAITHKLRFSKGGTKFMYFEMIYERNQFITMC